MISLLISSREKDRKNTGNLNSFVSSIRKSIYDPSNVELIFKFDDCDDLIEDELYIACSNNIDMNVKYIITPRYGYLGLHKAYHEMIDYINPNTYIIGFTADDFMFKEGSNWDKILLDSSCHLKDEPFIVQDETKVGKMNDTPFYSKKLIELITFGNSLSVDGLLLLMSEFYVENNLHNYIVTAPTFNYRMTCAYDWGVERWSVEREQLMRYFETDEYKNFIMKSKQTLKTYFKI